MEVQGTALQPTGTPTAPGRAPVPVWGHRPFRGQHETKLDVATGRFSIPAAYRHAFIEGYGVALAVPGQFVALWTPLAAHLFAERAKTDETRSMVEPRGRRELDIEGEDVVLDGQFRAVIPPRMREQVPFDGRVLVVGASDRLELWAVDAFRSDREIEAAKVGDFVKNAEVL